MASPRVKIILRRNSYGDGLSNNSRGIHQTYNGGEGSGYVN
jgi:hypothetical protein